MHDHILLDLRAELRATLLRIQEFKLSRDGCKKRILSHSKLNAKKNSIWMPEQPGIVDPNFAPTYTQGSISPSGFAGRDKLI